MIATLRNRSAESTPPGTTSGPRGVVILHASLGTRNPTAYARRCDPRPPGRTWRRCSTEAVPRYTSTAYYSGHVSGIVTATLRPSMGSDVHSPRSAPARDAPTAGAHTRSPHRASTTQQARLWHLDTCFRPGVASASTTAALAPESALLVDRQASRAESHYRLDQVF